MTPIATVRELVATINRHDWLALGRLLHPDFRRHSAAASESGLETAAEFVDFLKREHDTYPDAQEEILDIFADGSRVAARHAFSGTQLGPFGKLPATGRRVQSVYICLYRVDEGLIAESWAEWDNATDLRQLGLGAELT